MFVPDREPRTTAAAFLVTCAVLVALLGAGSSAAQDTDSATGADTTAPDAAAPDAAAPDATAPGETAATADSVAAATTPDTAPPDAVTPQLHAHRINPHAPRVDGKLDDPVWRESYFAGDFIAKEPDEGKPSSVSTEVAVVYDDEALYVAARMESPDPGDIRATVTRRDNIGASAQLILVLDSYHDKRTAYGFALTPAGVRGDWYHPGDQEGWRDWSYDPVWQGEVEINDTGWTAEMRIPFSQLRFNRSASQVWGINFNRFIPNTNEDTYWVMIPSAETGWSSRFGELVGIEDIDPPRRLEILPYYANDARVASDADPDDPFDSGRNLATRVGGDLKAGVGPNLTLDATVNPDFGQVEADPAVVNLSAFETFFSERRPFFIEGSQLLTGSGPGYFYSRRIGASPHGDADGDFVESPEHTTIITAGKLTGRLASGASLGALGAVTANEYARTFDEDTQTEGRVKVEPLTSFGVLRAQQEIGGSQSTVGGTVTYVHRGMEQQDPLAEVLNRDAIAGGTDWNLRFADGKYELAGHAGFSHVRGKAARIADVQKSSRRYFQRPDATHVSFDPDRTSLTGFTGGLDIEKNAGKHWLWEAGAWAESPGFEINDAGRLGTADDIDTYANLRYRQNEQGDLFRRYFIGLFLNSGWNFGGDRQFTGGSIFAESTWKNFVNTWIEYDAWTRALSDSRTRGGPLMGTGWEHEIEAGLSNNWAANTRWNAHSFYASDELGGWAWGVSAGTSFKPGSRWELSIDPSFRRSVNPRQYVDTIDGGGPQTYGQRYLFGFIDQTEISYQARLNYSFTPNLSLEYYAEPFAASGRYYDFGELEAARSRDLRTYGRAEDTSITEGENGEFTVTDGDDTFEFEQSNFNVLSYRTNFVVRWEWSPGSTLFLVWQQNRGDSDESGRRVTGRSLFDSLTTEGDNIVAIKVSYWLPIN